jgi:hypothetical protein
MKKAILEYVISDLKKTRLGRSKGFSYHPTLGFHSPELGKATTRIVQFFHQLLFGLTPFHTAPCKTLERQAWLISPITVSGLDSHRPN